MASGTIPLIGDESDLRHYPSDLLSEEGYRVRSLENPCVALTRRDETQPDRIFLDFRIARIDGSQQVAGGYDDGRALLRPPPQANRRAFHLKRTVWGTFFRSCSTPRASFHVDSERDGQRS